MVVEAREKQCQFSIQAAMLAHTIIDHADFSKTAALTTGCVGTLVQLVT